jgi:hypothetical protein
MYGRYIDVPHSSRQLLVFSDKPLDSQQILEEDFFTIGTAPIMLDSSQHTHTPSSRSRRSRHSGVTGNCHIYNQKW